MRKCEIKTKCPDLKEECGEQHGFLVKFSARVLIAMSSEFTFGDNSDASFVFSDFFMNLVDHDLTEYQITQTLTLP